MQRFTQAVKLNLTLRSNYNMKEIKQNNGANKTKRTCTLKNILYVTTLSILKNWTFILMVIRFKKVTKRKQLGIYIDENLQRSDHIDYLCSTISSKISLLKQLSLYIPVEAQKLYYQGCIPTLILKQT